MSVYNVSHINICTKFTYICALYDSIIIASFILAFSKPFVLYVVTDGDEVGEVENKGFSLMYRQLPCVA